VMLGKLYEKSPEAQCASGLCDASTQSREA
jgi:hypothetical protein